MKHEHKAPKYKGSNTCLNCGFVDEDGYIGIDRGYPYCDQRCADDHHTKMFLENYFENNKG